MRQLTLARYLLNLGIETHLFASITGPDWLLGVVEEIKGLAWHRVEERNFAMESYGKLGPDALLIDSYDLTTRSLRALSAEISRVACVVDGPWQNLSGNVAIAPSLQQSSSWREDLNSRFTELYSGPDFLMVRDEIRGVAAAREKRQPSPVPKIVISLGGGDSIDYSRRIAKAVSTVGRAARFDIFTPRPEILGFSTLELGSGVRICPTGPDFAEALVDADVVVVAAGTTVAEMVFLQIPAIFIPIAANQSENVRAVKDRSLGIVVEPDALSFEADFLRGLRRLVNPVRAREYSARCRDIIDGKGVERVARALIGAP